MPRVPQTVDHVYEGMRDCAAQAACQDSGGVSSPRFGCQAVQLPSLPACQACHTTGTRTLAQQLTASLILHSQDPISVARASSSLARLLGMYACSGIVSADLSDRSRGKTFFADVIIISIVRSSLDIALGLGMDICGSVAY